MQTIEKTIEVHRPVRAVYDQWVQFGDFPKFMEGIKEVRKIDDQYLRWEAEIGGKSKKWDAEIFEQVPDQRIRKAEELQAERARRHQELSLLDCLQLSDKAQIVARDERLRGMTQFESKRQVEVVTKLLENLRNNLAHSQDIVTNDWETVVMLAEKLDSILERTAGLRCRIANE